MLSTYFYWKLWIDIFDQTMLYRVLSKSYFPTLLWFLRSHHNFFKFFTKIHKFFLKFCHHLLKQRLHYFLFSKIIPINFDKNFLQKDSKFYLNFPGFLMFLKLSSKLCLAPFSGPLELIFSRQYTAASATVMRVEGRQIQEHFHHLSRCCSHCSCDQDASCCSL